MKECNICGKTKTLLEFSRDNRNSGGLSYYCRECLKDRRRTGYARWSIPPAEVLTCFKCGQSKKCSEFYVGQWSWCKECSRTYKRKPVRFETRLKNSIKQYGLSVEGWKSLYSEQKGLCGICKKPASKSRRMSVDHDHNTGNVRGLLCGNCNFGIGYLKESEEILVSAIAYLKKPQHLAYKTMKNQSNSNTLALFLAEVFFRIKRVLGFSVVKAKKTRAPRKSKPCVPSPTCCVDEYNAGKTLKPFNLAPVTNAELQAYVGDSCPGGHSDLGPAGPSGGDGCAGVPGPNSDNKISGPTS